MFTLDSVVPWGRSFAEYSRMFALSEDDLRLRILVDALKRTRLAAMNAFLDDYASGADDSRYVTEGLPDLPFADASFDLALGSHFLFLYSQQHDESFHLTSMRELCRVAREVRVFPLLALGGARSPHLAPAIQALEADGFETSIQRVPYEFQRGGNEMLRVVRSRRSL
jgi:hypothetical protein